MQQRYVVRIMASLAVTLLLLIGLVHLWPSGSITPASNFVDTGNETIQIEEIQPTVQSLEKRPPPPAPLPPVVVPNETIIETEPLDFTDSALPIDTPGEDETRQEGTSQHATAAHRPDTNARLLRYVEPEYTRAARRDDVRAEIILEVQVDAEGRVEEASIVKRRLLGENDTPARTVDELGYGLEEAALEAAQRCLFRPAWANGEPVPTRTTLTIRFGE